MIQTRRRFLVCVGLAAACAPTVGAGWARHAHGSSPQVSAAAAREVVILYTNDFHATIEPIAAYWLPNQPRLGGAAALAAYVNRFRAANDTVFLFDSGDMFTGLVSQATKGEALMEMMRAMRYDAMAIGNHEFDYGSTNFERQMARVPMPVLGANIFYKGTKHRYSRPYVILERNGVRVGVIGVIGGDAKTAVLAEGVTDLEFDDPATAIAPLVQELRPQAEIVVVLAHQGKTGPQQTDAEAHRELQRDFDEDVRLAGAVPGIDVLIGGHAHRGIERPFVHPQTGTVIVQTYGYGTRLGVLRLQLRDGRLTSHAGELVTTWTARVTPDPDVARVVERYRQQAVGASGAPIMTLSRRLYRVYSAESPLGNVVADAMRDATRAEVALQNPGGLRADLPDEPITAGHVRAVVPFGNTVDIFRMTGAQLAEVLEQGLTLDRGLMQVSGLRVEFDLSRPPGSRIVQVVVGEAALASDRVYTVATNSFLGQGGDLYTTFTRATRISSGPPLADVVTQYLKKVGATAIEPSSPFVPMRLLSKPARP
ncbi:MAG: bifunctional metallophosphatase/5'-nucleotidase [Acidimicrobiia bacterium]|nr:bifunctional metallophosphatase/5'-nucleotidase [Acidimicrobiia bacterium]